MLIRILINAAALLILSYVLEGIRVEGPIAALIAALVLGLVNASIRWVLLVLTLPLNVMTLGLFTFVINALMLMLVDAVVGGFEVRGFLDALVGSLLLSVISAVLSALVH